MSDEDSYGIGTADGGTEEGMLTAEVMVTESVSEGDHEDIVVSTVSSRVSSVMATAIVLMLTVTV